MNKNLLLFFLIVQISLNAIYSQHRNIFCKAPKPVFENLALDKMPSSSNPVLPHSVNAVLIGKMWNAYTTQASYTNQIFTDPFSGLIGVVHRIDRTGPGSGRVVYQGSNDGGLNWTPQIGPMNLSPWIYGRHPNIVLSNPTKSTTPGEQTPVAGWAELSSSWYWYQFSADQSFGAASFTQYIDSTYYPGDEMFVNSQGHIFAAVELIEKESDGTNYHLFKSTDKGLTWSKMKLAKDADFNNAVYNGTKGFINKNGIGYIIVEGQKPGENFYTFGYKKTTNDGATWDANWTWVNPFTLVPLAGNVHYLNYEVDAIVDGAGNLHFAGTFVDTVSGANTGIYHIWGQGSNWQAEKVASVNRTSMSLPGGLSTLNEVEFATNWDGTIVVLKWCDVPTPTDSLYDVFMTPVYGAPKNVQNITNTPNVNEKFSQMSAWGYMEDANTFRVDCMYTIFGNGDTNDLGEAELWYLRNITFQILPFPNCPVTWQTSFVASNSCNQRDTLIFGQSPYATNYIDPCLGEYELPPAPPSDVFYQRFILPNGVETKRDFRNDRANFPITWGIILQKGGCGLPVKLNWNKDSLPSNGTFILKDALGGLLFNIDMKAQDTLILIFDIDSLIIEYTPIICKNIKVQQNWNILSVPVEAKTMHKDSLFPGNISNAFAFENDTYVSKINLEVGFGYWLKFALSNNYNICGLQYTPRVINVRRGWNIIGPFENDVSISSIISNPPNIIKSAFFGWANGYFIADTLKSGKGYWIKCSSNGILILPSTSISIKQNFLENLPKIYDNYSILEFMDQTGNSSKLYLTTYYINKDNYELPPQPPNGIFDVRFDDNSIITNVIEPNYIILNSVTLPLKIKLYNFNGDFILISDIINGNIFNQRITNNEEIILDKNLSMLKLNVHNNKIDYSLMQNFPNPFNSKTKITFRIPEKQNVKLTIYNLLGEEIEILIDDKVDAGEHFVYFDGSNFPSGLYFYKLKTNNFVATKKMLLIK